MRIFTIVFLFFGLFASAQTPDDFVFTIDSSSFSTVVALEITGVGNINIDWGDGTTGLYTNPVSQLIVHSYSTSGMFTVIISDPIDSFKFLSYRDSLDIIQWGNSQWQTMSYAFQDEDVSISASDVPNLSQVSDMSYMFKGTKFNSDISNWDVSNVVNMTGMFFAADDFNQPLDIWDTSSVTNMSFMFSDAWEFNQPLNSWDTSNVTDMSSMFFKALDFNQSLNTWDVSNVTNMQSMFSSARSFNGSIDNWDVSNVTDMSSMFKDVVISSNPSVFNQPIDSWDVSNVTDMSFMFEKSESFNQPIGSWDVSNVTNMESMFEEASLFNQPIGTWNVSNVTNIQSLFSKAVSFNQPLNNWDVSSINSMWSVFSGAIDFNQDLNNWDVSNVTDFRRMFRGAESFNGAIGSWDVSNGIYFSSMFLYATAFNATIGNWDLSNAINLNSMFAHASAFNQPLNNWNVSSTTFMGNMFADASAFNQPLDNWNVSNVTTMDYMFSESVSFNQDLSSWNFNSNVTCPSFVSLAGLNVDNYDALLNRFVQLNLSYNVVNSSFFTFNASGLEYCDSFSREILIQNGWTINSDSLSSSCSDNIISGEILFDFNLNGCDPSDFPSENVTIHITDGTNDVNVYATNGQYRIGVPNGNYVLTPMLNSSLFASSPLSSTTTITNSSFTQDFCLTATAQIDDLEVIILPSQNARPGFDTYYKLIYKNNGTTVLSGMIDFSYEDDYMDLLTATPAATTSSVGSLNWSFSNLNPFETREIEFSMNLNTPTDPNFPLNSNDILNFNATINPTASDDTPLDNVFDLQQTVVNSYDPNDKTCLQGDSILPSEVGEYVHYRIRFENEGTASAITVKIIDYIDTTKYDISTLVPLSASHDYTTTITEGNKVEFLFDNINLPFTAPASQGYVLFKIKTVDTLVLGDDFSNQAEIYFDFNFPIITNLETTTVAVPLSLNDSDLFAVQLYPNPAGNEITITSNASFNSYQIYNATGKVLIRKDLEIPAVEQNVSLEKLSTGLYFIKISNGTQNTVSKLMKL